MTKTQMYNRGLITQVDYSAYLQAEISKATTKIKSLKNEGQRIGAYIAVNSWRYNTKVDNLVDKTKIATERKVWIK